MLKGIYAITDEILTPNTSIVSQVEAALKGGARIIQLRNKSAQDKDLIKTATQLQALCVKHKATFFINDRVELAQKIGADGVHIGYSDLGVKETRELISPTVLIGVSCYGDIERAKQAIKDGADYVAFGAFYPSKTKPKAAVVDFKVIAQAKKELGVPVCVIGGINEDNIKEIAAYQPDMFSLVSDIFEAKNIQEKVQKLTQKIKL
ncbi:MAG: thiamine phosphate synthase [Flavobacteriaceae bacterium]|nr:thiamine phosphate synthase [Flavobacteriaceae bacterium]